MVLVHASPTTLAPYRSPHLGVLSSPRRFYRESEGIEEWTWAADNDAFSDWNPDRYRRMLESIWGLANCLFVTMPDVVGDAERTLENFEEWYDDVSATLQPIALVAQDGMTVDTVPWQRFDALFIGGTDKFKMGADARALIRRAQLLGMWVHMGRVNTDQRFRYAQRIGCHSIDGTSLSWFRDAYLPKRLNQAAQLVMSDCAAERTGA